MLLDYIESNYSNHYNIEQALICEIPLVNQKTPLLDGGAAISLGTPPTGNRWTENKNVRTKKRVHFCLETCNTFWGQVLANNMWHISRKSHIKEPVYRVTWTDACTFWTCTTTWADYCSDGSFAGKVFITENDCIIKQTIPFQKQKMPEDIETADKLIKTVDCLLIVVIFFRSSWEPRRKKKLNLFCDFLPLSN